jgi:hypothetical protein
MLLVFIAICEFDKTQHPASRPVKNMIEYENARARLCPDRTKVTSADRTSGPVYLTDIFPALRMSCKDSKNIINFLNKYTPLP